MISVISTSVRFVFPFRSKRRPIAEGRVNGRAGDAEITLQFALKIIKRRSSSAFAARATVRKSRKPRSNLRRGIFA